jgi:hypothetical protein
MIKLTEYIVCAIENTYLVEMAYDRKKFKDLISSLSRQLMENWCLIRYISISGNKLQFRPHWSKELWSHIDNILNTQLKMNRRKAIEEVILGWEDMTDNSENHLYHLIARKFNEEGIDIDSEEVSKVIDDWMVYGCEELIDVLSVSNHKVNVRKYLDEI